MVSSKDLEHGHLLALGDRPHEQIRAQFVPPLVEAEPFQRQTKSQGDLLSIGPLPFCRWPNSAM